MKNLLFFAGLFGISLFAFSFSPNKMANFGDPKKETRNLAAFDKIGISGGFDKITLREGSTENATIEAEGIDLDKIVTEVEDGVLKIGFKKGNYSYAKVRISISYKNLKSVANSGSSDVVAETPIRGKSFNYASSGSGDFSGELQVDELEIAISGSSDMKLRGKAEKQDIAISGSGDVDASNLNGTDAKVAISGSGDVKLACSGKVKTSVSGSGNVTNSH